MSTVEAPHTTETDLRIQVNQAGHVLHHLGLVDYLGHCSARVPGTDRIVIKPKHSPRTRSPQQLTPEDMVVIDLDGELLEGQELPPAERFLHTEIYRARPDVGAVVHTHQAAATTLGVLGAPLHPLLHVPAVLTNGGRIQTWPVSRLVDDDALGRELASALGDSALCHLRGHGIVSVADGIPRATVTAIALEQLAEMNLTVLSTGLAPHVIDGEDLAGLRRGLAAIEGRWAYYLQLAGQPAGPTHATDKEHQ